MKFELVICIYNGVKSGQDDPPLQLLENLLLILWLKKRKDAETLSRRASSGFVRILVLSLLQNIDAFLSE